VTVIFKKYVKFIESTADFRSSIHTVKLSPGTQCAALSGSNEISLRLDYNLRYIYGKTEDEITYQLAVLIALEPVPKMSVYLHKSRVSNNL
jgi:hypothetical protein